MKSHTKREELLSGGQSSPSRREPHTLMRAHPSVRLSWRPFCVSVGLLLTCREITVRAAEHTQTHTN